MFWLLRNSFILSVAISDTDDEEEDDQDFHLNLAIQLSLQDLHARRLSEQSNIAATHTAASSWEGQSGSDQSLQSGDFTHLTANEILLDHLEKMTDSSMLKNTHPDEPSCSK